MMKHESPYETVELVPGQNMEIGTDTRYVTETP